MSETTAELEVVQKDSLQVMERVQIDSQIATARQWPRKINEVKATMLAFATLDEETAEACFYTLPARRNKDGSEGKPIQGPSVRMAEIALACYQHVHAGARIVADDGKFLTAQGICYDIQNNVRITMEVRRRVTTKEGRRFSDDMVQVTAGAACSLALRNAVFRVVPQALVKPIVEQAKRVAIGDTKSLVAKRQKYIGRLNAMGVTTDRIFAVLGIKTADEIGVEQLETLTGLGTAIKDGEVTIEEAFPLLTKQEASSFTPPPAEEKQPAPAATTPETAAESRLSATTKQEELEFLVTESGFDFSHFLSWANGVKSFGTVTATSFAEISTDIATRCINAKTGLLKGLKLAKEQGGAK